MFDVIKFKTNQKPELFTDLGNGDWYYNHCIEERIEAFSDPMQQTLGEELVYYVSYVRINGTPTPSNCYTALLNTYKDESGTSLAEVLKNPIENEEAVKFAENLFYDVQADFGIVEKLSLLERDKREVLSKIEKYDKSEEVNSFYLGQLKVWLDKDTRVGLMNSLTIEKNSGKEESTLWFNDLCININVDLAIQMLSALELYALECYNVTAQHKSNVLSLNSDVKAYDYTSNYPEKLRFEI